MKLNIFANTFQFLVLLLIVENVNNKSIRTTTSTLVSEISVTSTEPPPDGYQEVLIRAPCNINFHQSYSGDCRQIIT